jgi:hypothetical protein
MGTIPRDATDCKAQGVAQVNYSWRGQPVAGPTPTQETATTHLPTDSVFYE